MAEFSYPWSEAGGGTDSGTYTDNQWRTLHQKLFPVGDGVVEGLVVGPTGPASKAVQVAVGAAFVQGCLYLNTATAVTLPIADNTSGSARVDRIVLRLDTANERVRLAVNQGTPGGGAPALTQVVGGIWEISLARVAVANGFSTITAAEITSEARVIAVTPDHWTGLGDPICVVDNAVIAVAAHQVEFDRALVDVSATTLDMAAAADWIGGSSLEAASAFVWVYTDAAGVARLYDSQPISARPDGTFVATMQVNQAGWNGTSGLGLGATSVVYDTATGESSIKPGMWLGVFTDSAYRNGRGFGSGAAGGKSAAAWVRITAINTGTNTLTVAANNLAFRDNDYLIVVDGEPRYRAISGTVYRDLGARRNDASSNLLADLVHQGNSHSIAVNNGADCATTSSSYSEADSDFRLYIVTHGRPVQLDAALTVGFGAGTTGGLCLVANGVQVVERLFYKTVPSGESITGLARLTPGPQEIRLYYKSDGSLTMTIRSNGQHVQMKACER